MRVAFWLRVAVSTTSAARAATSMAPTSAAQRSAYPEPASPRATAVTPATLVRAYWRTASVMAIGSCGAVGDAGQHRVSDLQALLTAAQRHRGAYAASTRTLRKRQGAAPWPTCMDWPGSPLPQLTTPQRRHSLGPATASQERQNSGVMPLYSALRTSRVRLPSSISQPFWVPNWKLRRRSSMLQERLVSRKTPCSVPAIISSRDVSPGSRLTLVMRIRGMRDQPSARMVPLDSQPNSAHVSRDDMYPEKAPRSTRTVRCAGTPSSSQPKVPRPWAQVASATMLTWSLP